MLKKLPLLVPFRLLSLVAWEPGGEQPQQQQHRPTLTTISRQPAHISTVGRRRAKEEGGAGAPKAGRGEEKEGRGGARTAASPGAEDEEGKAGAGGKEEKGGREEVAGGRRAAAQREGESL